MLRSRMLRVLAVTVAAAGSLALAPTGAAAHGGGGGDLKPIRVVDDCEQVSFNEGVGAGTCVGDGRTTFQDFLAQLEQTGAVDDWEFKPSDVRLDRDEGLLVVNVGGEFHTFTEVAQFGGGCIPELNGGQPAVPECAPLTQVAPGRFVPTAFLETGVDAGQEMDPLFLAPGRHRFECLIHPWMRTEVVVRAHH